MMERILQHEIDDLKREILELSAMVENNFALAMKAVTGGGAALAQEVIETDHEIDEKEVLVEEECLKILALHQPVAIDLRLLVSWLKINNDLERIGDLAVNIAERSLQFKEGMDREHLQAIQKMASKTQIMLKESLDSLVQLDSGLAEQVLEADDLVDDMHKRMYETVISEIRVHPEKTETMIGILSVSRQLERIADHATNIAEDVLYTLRGHIVRHGVDHGH